MQPRISQRQSLACRECTRRKRKCDKEIPCSRCVRLGLNCDREVIYLRRHISQNGPEISFLSSLREELQSPNPARVSRAVQKLTERIEFLQSGRAGDNSSSNNGNRLDTARDTFGETSPPRSKLADSLSTTTAASVATSGTTDGGSDPDGQDSLIVTALEHIAWGRNYGSCYPHRRCACQYNRSWSELSSINSQSFQFARSPIAATVNLPDRNLAKSLVNFHMEYIAWHHNCIHSPTFLQQCNIFWETGECDQLQWIALYCSVLAASLFCLQHSPKYQTRFEYGLGSIPYSAQALFKTMLDILYESNFLQNISLYSVQATVISTEIAHNLGHSQLNATLFSAAIRIAECLGVHKIEDKDDDKAIASGTDSEAWHEALEREVGRRVWLQMVIQDHFAIAFTDSYGIHPADYSTSISKNANDIDLVPMPDTVPTVSTYTRVLASIAHIMPELADGMGPLKVRKPIHEQYEHVLAMDQKMRQVVRAIPKFLLQPDFILEAQIPWLCIARQSLAITAAEKIIMIHRPFMFRSFQSPIYAPTRRTCVSAAMTILREHRNITETGEVSLWTHTAFCITASLILCFELICHQSENRADGGEERQDESADQRAIYASSIQNARQYLASRTSDVIAQRGVLLINSIFTGMPGSAMTPAGSITSDSGRNAAASISFEEIVSRFSLDWAILGFSSDIQSQPAVSPVDIQSGVARSSDGGGGSGGSGGSGGGGGPGFNPETFDQDFEDFDAWFQHIFTTTSGSAPYEQLPV